MSLDINWSLLSLPSQSPISPSSANSSSTTEADFLASSLIASLNQTLIKTPRPSFIGPIHITSLDFGTTPPDIEIRDIRDVWRIFDEADQDEDEDEGEVEGVEKEIEDYEIIDGREVELWEYEDDYPHPGPRNTGNQGGDMERDDDVRSQKSVMSPRGGMSVASVGLGRGLSMDLHGGLLSPRLGGGSVIGLRTPSMLSYSIPNGLNQYHQDQYRKQPFPQKHLNPKHSNTNTHTYQPEPTSPTPSQAPSTPPLPATSTSIPSLQLHLRLSHTSDIHITLTTSLSINYPSPSFMSLPLKISITGITLYAPDLILAFSGERNRVHICIVDEEQATHGGIGMGNGGRGVGVENLGIGGRLLPDLKIESEIGHSDAHVLRNVGKVERFIADAVRKTLVEELVFPNFQTIAL